MLQILNSFGVFLQQKLELLQNFDYFMANMDIFLTDSRIFLL